VVIEVVKADEEFVGGADTKTIGSGDALLVDSGAVGAVSIRTIPHRIDAQGGVVAGLEVEIANHSLIAAAADGGVDLMLVHQERLLADLVNCAAGRTTAEQHRRRAAQHFEAIPVEGVAFVESGIAHAIDKDVAARLQREAAQANVFLTAFGRQEADAGGVVQRFLERIEIAVVDQAFGNHSQRLRNVAQILLALADARAGGLQGFLGRLLFFGFDLDG